MSPFLRREALLVRFYASTNLHYHSPTGECVVELSQTINQSVQTKFDAQCCQNIRSSLVDMFARPAGTVKTCLSVCIGVNLQ